MDSVELLGEADMTCIKAGALHRGAEQMRTVPEILKLAVSKYYQGPNTGMCRALRAMRHINVISGDEYFAVQRAVWDYIENELNSGAPYLDAALKRVGLPNSEEDCRAIYSDWDKRPMP